MKFNYFFLFFADDEDWNGDPADSTLYLMHGSHQVSLPRPLKNQDSNSENAREKSTERSQQFSRYFCPKNVSGTHIIIFFLGTLMKI